MHSFKLTYHINYGDGTRTKSSAEVHHGETAIDAWQEFLSTRKWYTPEEAAKLFFLEDWKIIALEDGQSRSEAKREKNQISSQKAAKDLL